MARVEIVKVIESNMDMIPIGEYTDSKFETLLEEYRKENKPSYPGATGSKIVDGA